ncbi:MAG: hypothetical protein WCB75_02220, partial [Pseudolabrys sp.]
MHQKIPSIIRIAAGVRVAQLILHQPYFNEERYCDYTVRPPSLAMSLLRDLEFIRQLAEGIFAVALAAIL